LAFNNFVLFDRVHLFAGARYRFLVQRFFRASARRALRLFLSATVTRFGLPLASRPSACAALLIIRGHSNLIPKIVYLQ
jgi:hypothetical protein